MVARVFILAATLAALTALLAIVAEAHEPNPELSSFLVFYSDQKKKLPGTDDDALYGQIMSWVERTGEELYAKGTSSETRATTQYRALLIALTGVKREAHRQARAPGSTDPVDRRMATRLYRQFAAGAYAHVQTEGYCGHPLTRPRQICQENKYRGSSRHSPKTPAASPFSY